MLLPKRRRFGVGSSSVATTTVVAGGLSALDSTGADFTAGVVTDTAVVASGAESISDSAAAGSTAAAEAGRRTWCALLSAAVTLTPLVTTGSDSVVVETPALAAQFIG